MAARPPAGRDRRGSTNFRMLTGVYAALDVHYPATGGATGAAVVASDRSFATVVGEYTARVGDVSPYRPGHFYARELPPLRAVLAHVGPVALLVVDGYVQLDAAGRPGLGAHVAQEFGVPVIGVAKTAFHGATHAVAVHRGRTARRPLYVTATGLPVDEAAELVRAMAGPYRLPDALRRVDALARGGP